MARIIVWTPRGRTCKRGAGFRPGSGLHAQGRRTVCFCGCYGPGRRRKCHSRPDSRMHLPFTKTAFARRSFTFCRCRPPTTFCLLFDRSGSTQDKWAADAKSRCRIYRQPAATGSNRDRHVRLHGRVQLPWTGRPTKGPSRLASTHPRRIKSAEPSSMPLSSKRLRREFKGINGRRALVVLTDGRDTSLYKDIVTEKPLAGCQR